MLWSSASVAGKPAILIVDASANSGGWESDFCDRLYATMKRRGILLRGSGPLRVERPEDMAPELEHQDSFNCVLLFGRSADSGSGEAPGLGSYWRWLDERGDILPKLFVACSWESYAPEMSEEILKSTESFAPLAIAQQTSLTPREAALYYLKFFTELELHSAEEITGKMVWFSASKAKELLRKRRLTGKFGVRC